MNKLSVGQILLDQLKDAHESMNGTMTGVTNEIARYMPPGKANPIAGTYAHLIMSEDFFIHMLLQNKPPLFETAWKDKTGASELQPSEWETAYPKWLKEVTVDIDQMQQYAKAVNDVSEAYVASLSDDDLSHEVDVSAFGMGKRTAASIISSMVIGHAHDIMGEISVLKGIQGLKGYPF
ncbi:MAG: DinB family protein [Candidatus Levybacteria bacterium]|nr:DinB family protein [Candidatus Levybacteria bacterium]